MDITGIGLSALNAYEKKLSVTANNIANLNTEKFRPSEATIQDNAGQGVYVTISQSNAPEVDLVKEMVNLMTAKLGVEISIKSIKTADEITKGVLDIIA